MSWVAVLSVVLCCSALVQSDRASDDQMSKEYTERYMQMFKAANLTMDEPLADALVSPAAVTHGTDFQCTLSASSPTTVHNLSPKFVDVVAAMGDSVTAALGARADVLLDIREFRGVSWSIGGDETLSKVTTLPNIIEHFNPEIKGFSTGIGLHFFSNAMLNVAVSGARTRAMLGQAETLVKRMQDMGITDNDWKLITIWIGGNDLCDVRTGLFTPSAETLAARYTENVKDALDYLKANVKRAFINLVQMIDISALSAFQGPVCGFVHTFVCNSILKSGSRARASETAHLYNRNLEQLIDGGSTYDSEDFTVVLQPIFSQTSVPRLPDGTPDDSFFAPDCFHFNQQGHSIAATYLWNNMFEPVGSKTDRIDWENLKPLKCPTEEQPYFSTYGNLGVIRSSAVLGGDTDVISSSLPSPSTLNLLFLQIMGVLGVVTICLLSH